MFSSNEGSRVPKIGLNVQNNPNHSNCNRALRTARPVRPLRRSRAGQGNSRWVNRPPHLSNGSGRHGDLPVAWRERQETETSSCLSQAQRVRDEGRA